MKKVLIQNNEQLELVREEIRLVTVIFFPFLIMLSFLLSLHKKDHGITTHIYYFPFFSTSDVLQIFRQLSFLGTTASEAAKAVHKPTKVECLSGLTIKLAALGSEHTVVVTDGGEALSWGAVASGRLGHGLESSIFGFLTSDSEYTPRLIKKLEGIRVKRVAAGLLHSACIDETRSLFVFGDKVVANLGFGEAKNATMPSMINTLPYSEEVACGGYHTCVVTRGGELYTWGSNENGCLGIGSTDVFHAPERIQDPFLKSPVSKVSCGWKHTAAISDGKVFTWGWGGSHGTFSVDGHSSGGQLGHGSDVDYTKPTMVHVGENVKALEISCGFNHTGAMFGYM